MGNAYADRSGARISDGSFLMRGVGIFIFGCFLYPVIEVVWRGYSHASMFLLGGIAFLSVWFIHRALPTMPLWKKAMLGGFVVTEWEFLFGVIFNLFLGYDVWDYSALPPHLFGQICLLYSFFWTLLSGLTLFLYKRVPARVSRV